MSDQRIWLLRHGESEWNAAGRWQGHGDPPLTPAGRRAAAEAAAALCERVRATARPLRIFCSDLQRASETAEIVADALGAAATQTSELRELDVGGWSGLTRAQIEEQDGDALAAFESEDLDVRPGGGETRREIRSRVRESVERLAAAHADGDLLLVVHLGVIRALVPGLQPANLELVETKLDAIRALRRL